MGEECQYGRKHLLSVWRRLSHRTNDGDGGNDRKGHQKLVCHTRTTSDLTPESKDDILTLYRYALIHNESEKER
ncbi:hypothetical protein L596_027027 [Steinernema carpocapsae]|uniref:Uncharacterized protein n=1 Tax=Steinernema carpocapsae TaxID=34508 RepID=A0A4U5M395_STECR|nr:hypothetical protein L596_027027 [Steinernema carpocapsae]